jgi:GxxExxY protein
VIISHRRNTEETQKRPGIESGSVNFCVFLWLLKRSMDVEKEFYYKDLSYEIIGAAIEVYKILGYGFLEKVYENAFMRELQLRVIGAVSQCPIRVEYKDTEVGDYYADIVVENKVVVELKTGESFNPIHEAQLLNYLKATGIKVGLLINFGPEKCETMRRVY